MTKLTRGVRTSEFWLHGLSILAFLAVTISNHLPPATLAAFGIPLGVINAAYSISRGWVKAANAAATPASPVDVAATVGALETSIKGLDPAVFDEIAGLLHDLVNKPTTLTFTTATGPVVPPAPVVVVAPVPPVVAPVPPVPAPSVAPAVAPPA